VTIATPDSLSSSENVLIVEQEAEKKKPLSKRALCQKTRELLVSISQMSE
jgi:hypothetical protein